MDKSIRVEKNIKKVVNVLHGQEKESSQEEEETGSGFVIQQKLQFRNK